MTSVAPGFSRCNTYLLITPLSYFLMKSTNLPSCSGCQKCRQADGGIALLVGRRVNGAFRHVHDETLDNGKERPVALRQLGDEARGVVVERLDCLQLQVGKRSGSGADFSALVSFWTISNHG
jgi:hypothetical protein